MRIDPSRLIAHLRPAVVITIMRPGKADTKGRRNGGTRKKPIHGNRSKKNRKARRRFTSARPSCFFRETPSLRPSVSAFRLSGLDGRSMAFLEFLPRSARTRIIPTDILPIRRSARALRRIQRPNAPRARNDRIRPHGGLFRHWLGRPDVHRFLTSVAVGLCFILRPHFLEHTKRVEPLGRATT